MNMVDEIEPEEVVEEELINYYSLGYNPVDGKVSYLFVNPYRTVDNEDSELFRDHFRKVTAIRDSDGVLDLEAIDNIVKGQARGIKIKMKIAAAQYTPEDYDDTEVLTAFGELYVAPVDETPDDEPLEESE